jgi:hypothetical protein
MPATATAVVGLLPLLVTMLARDPVDRPSAAQVVASLTDILDGPGVL